MVIINAVSIIESNLKTDKTDLDESEDIIYFLSPVYPDPDSPDSPDSYQIGITYAILPFDKLRVNSAQGKLGLAQVYHCISYLRISKGHM